MRGRQGDEIHMPLLRELEGSRNITGAINMALLAELEGCFDLAWL
jgi:hypothetical protein